MWQRARILPRDDCAAETHGLEVWVQVGPPTLSKIAKIGTDGAWCGGASNLVVFDTHVTVPGFAQALAVAADGVELLPEFSDNVQPVEYGDWVGGGAHG